MPRTYVLCTEDNIIPPAKQREMAARLGVEPIEIASDHAVFALQPPELAAVLAAKPIHELPGLVAAFEQQTTMRPRSRAGLLCALGFISMIRHAPFEDRT